MVLVWLRPFFVVWVWLCSFLVLWVSLRYFLVFGVWLVPFSGVMGIVQSPCNTCRVNLAPEEHQNHTFNHRGSQAKTKSGICRNQSMDFCGSQSNHKLRSYPQAKALPSRLQIFKLRFYLQVPSAIGLTANPSQNCTVQLSSSTATAWSFLSHNHCNPSFTTPYFVCCASFTITFFTFNCSLITFCFAS